MPTLLRAGAWRAPGFGHDTQPPLRAGREGDKREVALGHRPLARRRRDQSGVAVTVAVGWIVVDEAVAEDAGHDYVVVAPEAGASAAGKHAVHDLGDDRMAGPELGA